MVGMFPVRIIFHIINAFTRNVAQSHRQANFADTQKWVPLHLCLTQMREVETVERITKHKCIARTRFMFTAEISVYRVCWKEKSKQKHCIVRNIRNQVENVKNCDFHTKPHSPFLFQPLNLLCANYIELFIICSISCKNERWTWTWTKHTPSHSQRWMRNLRFQTCALFTILDPFVCCIFVQWIPYNHHHALPIPHSKFANSAIKLLHWIIKQTVVAVWSTRYLNFSIEMNWNASTALST